MKGLVSLVIGIFLIGIIPSSIFGDEIYPLLVSVSPDGEPGNEQSYSHSISTNGQFVVFVSRADNLVNEDRNHQDDVFVRDLLHETTELVSVASDGTQGAMESSYPTISGDGRYVVFYTNSGLDPDDTNDHTDVYLRDRESKQTIWISKPYTNDAEGFGTSGIISSNGKYVVFRSSLNSLGIESINSGNLFLWDNVKRTVTSIGIFVTDFDISGNGKKIVFTADKVPKHATEGKEGDLYVYDLDSKKTILITKPIDEFHTERTSDLGAMDFDGDKIVFRSEAPNLVEYDENNKASFFLHDMKTSKTKLISINHLNEPFFANSHPDISDDGKFVLMQGYGSLVYDVEKEKTQQISPFGSMEGGISEDGGLITFQEHRSTVNGLTFDDTQIFVTTNSPIVSDILDILPEEDPVEKESDESNPALHIEKNIFYSDETLKISGYIEDAQKGSQVNIIITSPDGTSTKGLTVFVTSDGKYETYLILDSNYEVGEYSILSSLESKILGKEKFTLESKTTKTPEKESTTQTKHIEQKVPGWIKNNAGWWSDGQLSDKEFVSGIQFLIKEKIISVPVSSQVSGSSSGGIPPWIKNNAGWWSDGLISEDEFVNAIKHLVENGIIRV